LFADNNHTNAFPYRTRAGKSAPKKSNVKANQRAQVQTRQKNVRANAVAQRRKQNVSGCAASNVLVMVCVGRRRRRAAL
jgi:hypothetical protein